MITREQKINAIAETQQKLNKKIQEWVLKENNTLEKRSSVHGNSDVFKDIMGKEFTIIPETITMYDFFTEFYVSADKTADSMMQTIDLFYRLHAKKIENREDLQSTKHAVKFIYHGLHYIDEDTVELKFGLTNIIDPVDNIQYI